MSEYYYIVMGDVIGSSRLDSNVLSFQLADLLEAFRDSFGEKALSPFTTTLGDEFQGVCDTLKTAVESIIFFEEKRYMNRYDFSIRYIIHYGKIDTKLNRDIAYGMIGPGLTFARKQITENKKNKPDIQVFIEDEDKSKKIEYGLRVLVGIKRKWSLKDSHIVMDMLGNSNNSEVGKKNNMHRSQVWKRRKNLLIEEYNILKSLIYSIIS